MLYNSTTIGCIMHHLNGNRHLRLQPMDLERMSSKRPRKNCHFSLKHSDYYIIAYFNFEELRDFAESVCVFRVILPLKS
jgi:hypothetical protein